MPDASTALCRSHTVLLGHQSHAWTPQFTLDSGTVVACGRPHSSTPQRRSYLPCRVPALGKVDCIRIKAGSQ